MFVTIAAAVDVDPTGVVVAVVCRVNVVKAVL